MKPSLTLTLIFAAILSACARGTTPTAPSQLSNSVQQSTPTAGRLSFVPNPAVANEPTTFSASIELASSSVGPAPPPVNATLDFGDGTRADFVPVSPVLTTAELKRVYTSALEHIYTRAGSFTATFSLTNAAGGTVSVSIPVIVR
jgi:PKD domain